MAISYLCDNSNGHQKKEIFLIKVTGIKCTNFLNDWTWNVNWTERSHVPKLFLFYWSPCFERIEEKDSGQSWQNNFLDDSWKYHCWCDLRSIFSKIDLIFSLLRYIHFYSFCRGAQLLQSHYIPLMAPMKMFSVHTNDGIMCVCRPFWWCLDDPLGARFLMKYQKVVPK